MDKLSKLTKELETKKNKLNIEINKIKKFTKINDIDINVSCDYDKKMIISLTDTKNMWSSEYYTIYINIDGNYKIKHSTGGWKNNITGYKQIETINNITEVLKHINNNISFYVEELIKIIKLENDIDELKEELKKLKTDNYIKNIINEGFKIYNEKDLKKLFLNNINKNLIIEVCNPINQTKERWNIIIKKINNRYKIINNDNTSDIYSLKEIIFSFKNYFLKINE